MHLYAVGFLDLRKAVELSLLPGVGSADGIAAPVLADYLPRMCTIANWLFDTWARNSTWLGSAVAVYMTAALPAVMATDDR